MVAYTFAVCAALPAGDYHLTTMYLQMHEYQIVTKVMVIVSFLMAILIVHGW